MSNQILALLLFVGTATIMPLWSGVILKNEYIIHNIVATNYGFFESGRSGRKEYFILGNDQLTD